MSSFGMYIGLLDPAGETKKVSLAFPLPLALETQLVKSSCKLVFWALCRPVRERDGGREGEREIRSVVRAPATAQEGGAMALTMYVRAADTLQKQIVWSVRARARARACVCVCVCVYHTQNRGGTPSTAQDPQNGQFLVQK